MNENQDSQLRSEWSHYIDVAKLTEEIETIEIEPTEEEQRDLSKRLGIQSIHALKANLNVHKSPLNGLIHVKGSIQANVIQTCVVTLDPVQDEIEETVEGWFGRSDQVISISKVKKDKLSNVSGIELPILEEQEDPEPIVNGQIDLGEFVTQHLSLSIDPYPHKEGVEFEHQHDNQAGPIPESRQNPFAKLRDWKDKQSKDESTDK